MIVSSWATVVQCIGISSVLGISMFGTMGSTSPQGHSQSESESQSQNASAPSAILPPSHQAPSPILPAIHTASATDARIGDAMTREVPTIGHRACLEEAIRLLQEKQAPAVGVVDAVGRLVGLITSETIGEMLMVREALPQGVRVGPWSRPA